MGTGRGAESSPQGESIESAVARMTAAGADRKLVVHRLTATDLILDLDGVRAGVVVDEPAQTYHLTGVPDFVVETLGPGGPAFGMGRHPARVHTGPGVLLAGKSWRGSLIATREHATGRWELGPTDDLSRFAYQQLTAFGWHRAITGRAALGLALMPAFGIVVLGVLIAAFWWLASPWAALAIVLAVAITFLGMILQGPRTPQQASRKRRDTLLFWAGLAGVFLACYLFHRASNGTLRAAPAVAAGALLVLGSALAQWGRR